MVQSRSIFFGNTASNVAFSGTTPKEIAAAGYHRNTRQNTLELRSAVDGRLQERHRLQTPSSRLKWLVASNHQKLLATTSLSLQLWARANTGRLKKVVNLVHQPRLPGRPAPITSLDWLECAPQKVLVGTCEDTCLIWDIEQRKVEYNGITNDKEVFEVAFSGRPSEFATASADGTVRLFDTRIPTKSTILFEEESNHPLAHISWNKLNPQSLACFGVFKNTATLLDRRKPGIVLVNLEMEQSVTDLAWSPETGCLLALSDVFQIKIWDLTEKLPLRTFDSLYIYQHRGRAKEQIQQIIWQKETPKHILLSTTNSQSFLAL